MYICVALARTELQPHCTFKKAVVQLSLVSWRIGWFRVEQLSKYNEWRKSMADQDLGNTQFFKVDVEPETGVKKVLSVVYDALLEKGYNPVNQIVGYIMSGDPTYITSHKGARSLIMKVERDELVEEMLTEYIRNNNWGSR